MSLLSRKKSIMGALLVISSMLILAACGGNASPSPSPTTAATPTTAPAATPSPEPTEEPAAEISGSIDVVGSTSVQGLAEELAEAFMAIHGDARVSVSGGGSGVGIRSAQDNIADIGMASREIREDETGIEDITIAIDGIAVVVHPGNEVGGLTQEQVKEIYIGNITNWSEVGGSDSNIVVVGREEGSGTRDAFAEIVLGSDPFLDQLIIQSSTGGVREAVGQDVNAIGYISLGGVTDVVKALAIDEVDATEDNVKTGAYPIARPFSFLVNDSEDPSDVAQAFIDFVLSSDGQAIVADNGFVTVE